ncbi:MAG: DUF58 domain-containing protein, partial [Paracoccus sp. (in: a-proteobacteria)]
PRNHLVLVFSDFDMVDDTTERLVAGLARRNDLVLGLVWDPFSQQIPAGHRLVVSDGVLQAEIDTTDPRAHGALSDFASARLARIRDWQRRFGIPVLPLSAAEDSLAQMRRLMGLAGGRR